MKGGNGLHVYPLIDLPPIDSPYCDAILHNSLLAFGVDTFSTRRELVTGRNLDKVPRQFEKEVTTAGKENGQSFTRSNE